MSLAFNWLPPLGFDDGRQARTTVEISQLDPYGYDESLRRYDGSITMSFEADVYFVSENTDRSTRQKELHGLAINEWFEAKSVAGITKKILEHFRPYFTDQITWKEKHYYEKGPEPLEMSIYDMFDRIEKFVIKTLENADDYGGNAYSLQLEIRQEIAIADEELRSWNFWYAAMEESYPGFESEWEDRISRPRTEEDLMITSRVPVERCVAAGIQTVAVARSCPICLEEVPAGSPAIRLSCGHMFGDKCMKKWLQRSNTCPMCCSYVLRSSFEHLL